MIIPGLRLVMRIFEFSFASTSNIPEIPSPRNGIWAFSLDFPLYSTGKVCVGWARGWAAGRAGVGRKSRKNDQK